MLKALIAYLYSQAPKEEQNFATLMYMLEHLEAREDDENYKSPVDLLFEDLAFFEPENYAVSQYKADRKSQCFLAWILWKLTAQFIFRKMASSMKQS